MPSLGSALLALAFVTSLVAAALALAGRNGDRRRIDLSRRAVYVFLGLITACVAIIEIAFASDDFAFNIVAFNADGVLTSGSETSPRSPIATSTVAMR